MEDKTYLNKARNAYKAYRLLSRKGLVEDAYSRGYYTVLHLCHALLLKNRETLPKTHSGLVAKLWALKEKIKVDKELVSEISRIQALRESGDYAPISKITKEDMKILDGIIKNFAKKLGEKLD